MTKPTNKSQGFINFTRQEPGKRPVDDRLRNYEEFEQPLNATQMTEQAIRCMDCGIPFCHSYGCPVHNRIPEWIDMVYRDRWKDALDLLHATDNFPEITGRVCPAPCEAACTLSINQPPVLIRHIELQIIERGFAEGWVKPEPPNFRSGKKVAVIGSGPAGLTAAQQLVRRGHQVTVFEKDDRAGGLLRYGIPDFKLEKRVLERRINQMIMEGVRFETNVNVGLDLSSRYLQRSFDAMVLTLGALAPRDLKVPGRDLKGVHFAVPFLTQQNRRVAGDNLRAAGSIYADGCRVAVIGGGDTGSDCIGTSNRQGAASITQLEILPKPPDVRTDRNPWPTWPQILRTSSSQEEGCERMWGVATKEFLEQDGAVSGLSCVRMKLHTDPKTGKDRLVEVPDSGFVIEADLVLLAMGFVHVEHGPFIRDLVLDLDERGNIVVDKQMQTSQPGVFAAGDAVEGASLVVRAFQSGREVATCVDRYLTEEKI